MRRPRTFRFGAGVAFVLLLANCVGGGAYGPLAAACPQMTHGDPLAGRYSANARANVKIAAFVAATADLVNVSITMERLAADACLRMGRDLGVPDTQMRPVGDPRQQRPGAEAHAACGVVSQRIDEILRAGVQVRASAQPPHCQASVDAKAQCEGRCNVDVDPGEIVAQCEPARLSGFCQGRCIGQCDGNCQGDCQGQCSARDASGRCVGRCQGTCNGGCDASCHARCEGQWQAPQCQGYVRPPSVDADCKASCSARANFQAHCQPGHVNVQTSQNTELVARLVATLQANLPDLIRAEVGLGKRLVGDARAVVQIGSTLPRTLGNAGAEAMACVAAASSATFTASARIDVSIQASASVTSRVGAS
ncbi:MAG: hypothetical protein ACOY0T_05585 [Myxococcota bacterium]